MMLGHHLITLAAAAEPKREQWVHLLPAGTFDGRDGRGPYSLDDADAVIEATRQAAGTMKLPIDYDHAIDLAAPKGQPAPAAGWIKGLQARAGGIWGLVQWTERAARLIAGKEYRYLSPVFKHARDGRIHTILRAALTNNPNLNLVALASSGADTMNLVAELRKLVKIDENADDGAVLKAVQAAIEGAGGTAAAAVDPTKYVPIGDFTKAVAELNQVRQGVSLQTATETVERSIERGCLPPFLKDWGISLCSVNKPAFDAFIDRVGRSGIFGHLDKAILSAVPPGAGDQRQLGADQGAVARNLGLSADEFTKAGRA